MAKKETTYPKWINDHITADVRDSELFKFKVTFPNGKMSVVNTIEDMDIDYDSLEDHLETIPAQYVFWASVYSELRSTVAIQEIKIARRKAHLTKYFLEEFKKKGVKLTDKQLTQLIESDDIDPKAIARNSKAHNLAKPEHDRLSDDELSEQISKNIANDKKKTLPYLEAQLALFQKNTGKLYHMVEAIRMRSEHCRSLAGFKRQDKEQSSNFT